MEVKSCVPNTNIPNLGNVCQKQIATHCRGTIEEEIHTKWVYWCPNYLPSMWRAKPCNCAGQKYLFVFIETKTLIPIDEHTFKDPL